MAWLAGLNHRQDPEGLLRLQSAAGRTGARACSCRHLSEFLADPDFQFAADPTFLTRRPGRHYRKIPAALPQRSRSYLVIWLAFMASRDYYFPGDQRPGSFTA
ncbi:MAG: hypothetical protein MZV63_27180 [Marinilabiliales bacterium]|nr:hypothetical protein [Marinilabiliales bacterium]